jgi:hypothetical protein
MNSHDQPQLITKPGRPSLSAADESPSDSTEAGGGSLQRRDIQSPARPMLRFSGTGVGR